MSIRSAILDALATRLGSVTTANGYSTDVKKVYYNEIPMGIELNSYQLPAIFVLDGDDFLEEEHRVIKGTWNIDLQLWHNRVSDEVMSNFVRDVLKAVYANHPSANLLDAFRMHPQIVEVKPLLIGSDLNMIETNRVREIKFEVRYRTQLYNM